MTGAGLHLDDISDDEDKKFTGLEEDNTYEDIMAEIKRDVFKWKNVRVDSERNLTRQGDEDDLADVRRLLKEVGTGMNQHGPEMMEFGPKLKNINKMMSDLGCAIDPKLFEGIDEDTDYIRSKKYNQFKPGDRVTIEASLRPVKVNKKRRRN